MVADPAAPEIPGAKRQLDPAPAGAVRTTARAGSLTAAAVIATGIVVVVAQPEEPDQPDHEQADVEDAKPDHEDPPLGGHRVDASAMGDAVEALCAYPVGFATWLLGT